MILKGGVPLLLAILALSACAPNKKKAQEGKSDGVLVQLDKSEDIDVQKMFPGNSVTVIDLEDRIYQIQGAGVDEVKNLLPRSHIEINEVKNYLNPELEKKSLKSFEDKLLKKNNVYEKYVNLGCHRNAPQPSADISLRAPVEFIRSTVVRINSSPILLTGRTSQLAAKEVVENSNWAPQWLNEIFAPEEKASSLELHWVMDTPPGTSTQKEINGADADIIPDQYGGFTAILIAQDSITKACGLDAAIVGVTANNPYRGRQFTATESVDTNVFHHISVVNSREAWNTTRGEGTVIAVLDTGMNYNHPELADNLYINPNEAANGVDDDGNGIVDDIYGYDFAMNDNIPFDDESHGTHVTGIAAGKNIGIAPNAKVLPVKVLLSTGSGSNSSILAGIYYAIKMKVDVINMSLGGSGPTSPIMLAALKKAQEAGILVVVASGNSGENVDVVESHFTNKDGSNILAISSTDENGSLTDYSNYGARTVDLAAPGGSESLPVSSASTWFEYSKYIRYSGTSMASPVAAGVAALVKSVNPRMTAEELKSRLISTSIYSPALVGKIANPGVVNAKLAVSLNSINSVSLQ